MPGLRHFHGQGLRAGGLQHEGLHLGQGGSAGSGGHHPFFGALGDIHGDFAAARRILAAHPEVPFWLCVGDIASEDGRYESLGAPVYWIHGNNDNFDAIASGDLPSDLLHIPNGTAVAIEADPVSPLRPAAERVVVAGLGGTFAPTWYETPAADLPHPKKGSARATELADKRRHFVRDEVGACLALRGVDVFLSHEAPKPYRPSDSGRGPDAGKPQINDILRALQPRLHCFGHHHRFTDRVIEGVRSIGLDLVSRSYVLVDRGSGPNSSRDTAWVVRHQLAEVG